MSINVEYKENKFNLPPVGLKQAVCCEVLDLGFDKKTYKDQATGQASERIVHEYQYVFQLNEVDPDTGKRFEIRSKPMNLTLGDRSTLRDFLRQWRGHDLTDAEKAPPGVDIDLKGRNALISVIHTPVGDKTYANIGSITPLMAGMPEIQPLNYESKQAAVDKAKAEAAAAGAGQNTQAGAAPNQQPITSDTIQNSKEPIPF